MSREKAIDPALLREILTYNEFTGEFVWKQRPPSMFRQSCPQQPADKQANSWNKKYAGKTASSKVGKRGYRTVSILGKNITAHRVAWAYHHGEWPDGMIDHINRNRTDNRISNLRVVTPLENARNVGVRIDNKSGVTGVSFVEKKNKWKVQIVHNGKPVHIPLVSSFDEAVSIRREAEVLYGYRSMGGQP